MVLADSTYAYLTAATDYASGNLIDTGWVVGPKPAVSDGRAVESRGLTPAAIFVPVLPVLGALSVAAIQMELGHRLDPVGWSIAVVLVGLVLVRQGLLIVELLRPRHDAHAPLPDRMRTALGGPLTDTQPEP